MRHKADLWKLACWTLFFVCFAVWCGGCGKQDWRHGTVIERSFVPSSTGTGISTSGKLVVTSTSEKYVVVVRLENGDIESVELEAKDWATFEKGEAVRVDCRWWGIAAIEAEERP